MKIFSRVNATHEYNINLGHPLNKMKHFYPDVSGLFKMKTISSRWKRPSLNLTVGSHNCLWNSLNLIKTSPYDLRKQKRHWVRFRLAGFLTSHKNQSFFYCRGAENELSHCHKLIVTSPYKPLCWKKQKSVKNTWRLPLIKVFTTRGGDDRSTFLHRVRQNPHEVDSLELL